MKKSIKIVSIALMILAMIFVSTSVFATDTNENFGPTNISINTSGTNTVQDVGSRILGIVRVVGTIVAVGMLIVLGVKYMMGSAEERAEYKKTLLPYLIGAVLIFAATNLANMVYTWAQSL